MNPKPLNPIKVPCVPKEVSQNEVVYGAALSACERVGQWQAVLQLLEDMATVGLRPNELCFSAAIGACKKLRCWVGNLLTVYGY